MNTELSHKLEKKGVICIKTLKIMRTKASNFQFRAAVNNTKLLYTIGQKPRCNVHPYEDQAIQFYPVFGRSKSALV